MTKAAPTILACGAHPRHHWLLTTTIDGERYTHHECQRCEAQKDVPTQVNDGVGWRPAKVSP